MGRVVLCGLVVAVAAHDVLEEPKLFPGSERAGGRGMEEDDERGGN